MIGQTIDIENLSLQLEGELERYQQEYKIKHGDMAWILLRIGTNYYLKDLCSRGLNGNGQFEDNGHI
jgi:hypothetical protein